MKLKTIIFYILLLSNSYPHWESSEAEVHRHISYEEAYDPERRKLISKYHKAKKERTVENVKKLIEILHSDYEWIYFDEGHASGPPSYFAGKILTTAFPESGFIGTHLLPQVGGLPKLQRWFEINGEKIGFNDDGSHYWKESPIDLDGNIIKVDNLSQKEEKRVKKTQIEGGKSYSNVTAPHEIEDTIPINQIVDDDIVKKKVSEEVENTEEQPSPFPRWILCLVLIVAAVFLMLKSKSKR